MIKKKDLSQEDKETWEDFINNPTNVYDKDNKNFKINRNKGRFKFDLHGYTLDDANKRVKEIILYCVEKKYKEILVITGKGIHSSNNENIYVAKDLGRLKFSVPEFVRLDQELSSLIVSINDAETKDGGDGAIIIKLKNL